MDELLNQYVDMFHENFPLFCYRGVDENELMTIIQKCIDEGKPLKVELEDDRLY